MTVYIITLKTGDRVIAGLKEIFDADDTDKRGVCLLMDEPYVLTLEGDNPPYLVEQYGAEYQIRFSKWNPYSTDTTYKIPYDTVMTISTPEEGILTAYNNKIAKKKELKENV